MSRIELALELGEDFERILDHLARHEVEDPPARLREIVEACDVLERNPFIGRPAGRNMGELVIGRRARGYLALYRYVAEIDTVFVLALRSQRAAGYTGT
jgi:plasmid stabilization system protein ParE